MGKPFDPIGSFARKQQERSREEKERKRLAEAETLKRGIDPPGVYSAVFTGTITRADFDAFDRALNESVRGTYRNPDLPVPPTPTLAEILETVKQLGPPPPRALPGVFGCTCPLCMPQGGYTASLFEARARELEARVSLVFFPIPVKWRVERGPMFPHAVPIAGDFEVRDRDTGSPRSQGFSMHIPVSDWTRRPLELVVVEFARGFRKFLVQCLMHEVDEAIHVLGERIFDPHNRGRALPSEVA